jgi:PAS domain S-box-containing protein
VTVFRRLARSARRVGGMAEAGTALPAGTGPRRRWPGAPRSALESACLATCLAALAGMVLLRLLPASTAAMPAHTSLLTVHLLLELFALSIATLIVIVSWHTFSVQAQRPARLLIIGFTVVGVCDLAHALTYAGMPPLLGASSTPRAIFFWLAGRSAEVFTLGAIALGWLTHLQRGRALAAGLGTAALLVWLGSARIADMPETFVPGLGVTPFKAGFEIVLCGLNVLVALSLWRRARAGGGSRCFLLATSAFVIGVGELAFTSYVQPSDFQNLFGHLYKLAAYALLYAATFGHSLRAPFEALRESEQRAAEGERRMRALSDNLPHCIVYQVQREADGSRRFTYVSEAVERLFGVTAAQVLEDPGAMYRRIHPEDSAIVAAAERQSIETLQVFDVEVRMRHVDGRERFMHLVSAPRRLDGGRACWDGVQLDVTERHVALQRVRENEALLTAVIRSASDAIVSTDIAGRITLFNAAAERIFGHGAASVIGGGLDRLLPLRARGRHAQDLAGFARSDVVGRRMGGGRVQGLRADGTELELEASISQVTVNHQHVLTAMLRDVTDRVRTERALMQTQVELTELTHQLMAQEKATSRRLAQVLHDQLGQTLTAMRIDFVAEAELADPAQAARHARVDQLIDQAVREVRQVLVELRPTLLDERGLAAALDNELATRRLSAQGVKLVLDVPPVLAAQRWPADVEYAGFMVAREAVNNALRHAAAAEVRVALDGGPLDLALQISDDGRGLAGEPAAVRPGHLGMVGMRERAIAIGAHFEVTAVPGGGTCVRLGWEDRRA